MPVSAPHSLGVRAAIAAALVATGLGVTAGQASAAVNATLSGGTLTIKSNDTADKIALRTAPGKLVVDFGDNSTADKSFLLSQVKRIAISAGKGDDRVRFDRTQDGTPLPPVTFDGGAGTDTIAVIGSAAADALTVSAEGAHAIASHSSGVRVDTVGVEAVVHAGQIGPDTTDVQPLKGTAVRSVTADEAALQGGASGDGQVDRLLVSGSLGDDFFELGHGADSVIVEDRDGVTMTATRVDPVDVVTVNGRPGDDLINAAVSAAPARLVLQGGDGNDHIDGSGGAEVIESGAGNDFVAAGGGDDVVDLGAGQDEVVTRPGQGLDQVNGGPGLDVATAAGTAASEDIDAQAISAGVAELAFTVFGNGLDTVAVERFRAQAGAGHDRVRVFPLDGTAVRTVDVDLSAAPGSGTPDARQDEVVVIGTHGDDTIAVAGAQGNVAVSGLFARTELVAADPADFLRVETLEGTDKVSTGLLLPGTVQLTVN